MTPARTVLVSGASIAGPALAYWLSRYGFTPTVVERSPAPRTGGYKVDIRGAAVHVVERMGLLDRRLATVPAALFMGRDDDDVEVMRGEAGVPNHLGLLLEDRFAGNGWDTEKLLAATNTADDFYFDEVSQVDLPSWTKGRTALVGDAGYCPSFASGQGSSLALVGAYLGRMVAKSNFQAWMGVQFMRLLPRLPGKNAVLAKITRPIHEAADAVTLRDYG